MRIALLTYEFPGCRPGGIGSYVVKCAQALAAAGHEPHIFTLSLPPDCTRSLPPEVHVHQVPELAEQVMHGTLPGPLAAEILNGGPGLYKLALGWALCQAVRQVHAQSPLDVVEAAEYEALALPLMWRPEPGLPVVTQIHLGSAVNRHANQTAPGPEDALIDALEAAAILAADGVCGATQSVLDQTRQFVAVPQSAAVLPHALVPQSVTPRAPRDGPVLFLGRLQKRKGCQVLALAANQFLAACPAARLHMVGSDTPTADGGQSMHQWMVDHIAPDLHSRVLFKGELGPEDVRKEIAGCRFQVVPSLVENFANTAGEALAAARTVVYAGGTGTDELVGDAGLRVFPVTPEHLAEALIRLYQDDALLEQLSRRAQTHLKTHFSIAQTIAARIAFYRTLHDCVSAPPRTDLRRRLSALAPDAVTAVLDNLAFLAGESATAPKPAAGQSESPGQRVRRALDAASARLGRPPRTWLLGAGRYTMRLLAQKHVWESRGHRIAGLIDDHPRFNQMPVYLGLPVLSRPAALAQVDRHELNLDLLILSTDTFEEQFWERTTDFRARGISTVRLSNVV